MSDPVVDAIAQAWHEAYERKAPDVGYAGRPEAAVPWAKLPHGLKVLARATVVELLSAGVIAPGCSLRPSPPPS